MAWADAQALDGTSNPTQLAGDGTPPVDEFELMEVIAVLGRSPLGGRDHVARIVECAWRLPSLYRRVVSGRVAPWRAERVADLTRSLNADAARFVDAQLPHLDGLSWVQIERLVAEAVLRFDPDRAEAERQAAADRRRCDVSDPDDNGIVHVDAVLDAADGRDLEQAVARRAELRGRLGDDSTKDVRRSQALGDLARKDLELDLLLTDPDTGEVTATSPGRKVTLNLHVTDTTVTGENPVARWMQRPVSGEQVREWCRTASSIIVRSVIDLADCVPVDSYEIPDRHRRQVEIRDHTCRFPHCTRPAERCDLDHAVPHGKGGPTCPCNLVPLCRRHHRAKTHSRWRYEILAPGRYRWTSPHGHQFDVGPEGTTGPPARE